MGLHWASQQEIDDFPINYPSCTEIIGDLIIQEESPGTILNLYKLSQLTSVKGDLIIGYSSKGNTVLNSLEGLENMTSVGGSLFSYDPNDKLVNPTRGNNYTLFGEDLTYTIRFQNTGNDYARDVVIRDTLDAKLDASTFKLLSSSHPAQLALSLEADQYLTFSFEDIFLPDSTFDFGGSQGYITYLISPKDGLSEKTEINNTASISFDSNPPIVTNTTQNILVNELAAVHEIANIKLHIFPNPVFDRVYIQAPQVLSGQIQLADYTGKLLSQQSFEGNTELDLSLLKTGIYLLTIQTGEGSATEKIVKF